MKREILKMMAAVSVCGALFPATAPAAVSAGGAAQEKGILIINGRDIDRLRQMLDAAREARRFAGGKSSTVLKADRMLALAVLKDIEIIGQSAGRVTAETREKLGGINWAGLEASRKRSSQS